MEHVLTMANLKLKPSLFTPRPSVYVHVLETIDTQNCMHGYVQSRPVGQGPSSRT